MAGLALMIDLDSRSLQTAGINKNIDLVLGSIQGRGNVNNTAVGIRPKVLPDFQEQVFFRLEAFWTNIPGKFHHDCATPAAGNKFHI